MPQSYEAIRDDLLAQRYSARDIPRTDAPGVYALFLAGEAALSKLITGPHDLLYIGKAPSGLDVRNHFLHTHSGFSTLRRSLGALLKAKLSLQAIPRGPGASQTNITNYRFTNEGEQRLTAWMERRLAYNHVRVENDIGHIEKRLIAELGPPLNLTNWPNPQAPHLKALRGVCADEARSARTGHQ